MESINLDLESNSHKNIDISLNTQNAKPQSINVDRSSNIGMDLLVNKKKTSGESMSNIKQSSNSASNSVFNPSSPQTESKQINIDTNNSNSEGMVDLDKLLNDNSNNSNNEINKNINNNLNDNSLDDLDLNDLELNIDNLNVPDDPIINMNSNNIEPQINPVQDKQKTYEDLQKEKFELLCKLERLESKGIKLEKHYNMQSDFDEMKHEFERLSSRREVDQSVKFQQKMLVAFVTATEFLNNRFDPLDGWSENVHENVHDYDDVFEELHEKYKSKAKMAPELRLLMMLGGSAFMFHLTNTMFKTSLPAMGDIMKQNPDLMQQFAKATVNSMGPQEPGFSDIMNNMVNTQMPSHQRQPAGPQRPEMKAPPDINTILNELSDNRTNVNNIDISDLSESDSDVRNISLNGGSGRREINLEL